jgi:hypothetical protein
MRPRRSEADDCIAGAHLRAVDDAILLHDADAEARKVIIRPMVHTGHLGGLAADQCAARLPASLGDARDDTQGDLYRQVSGCVVVEEEQRLRALHDHVIDAHRNQVDSDAIVPARVDRKSQLGADAVGAGHQHRLAKAPHR